MDTNNTNTQTPISTISTNTTFIDQAPLSTEYAQQEPVLPPNPKAMPDEDWFAAQQLSKPIVLTTQSWTTANLADSFFYDFNIPDVINSIDTLQSRTLQMYAFYRANWVLRFQLNGTKFHQGQLIAAVIPFNQRAPISGTATGGYTVLGLTGFPSVQISASATAPVELKIPFVHLYDYFMTNAVNDIPLARVQIGVLNRLLFSTGASPSLNLTISLYAEQAEVHVPIYDHVPVFSEEVEAHGLFGNVAAALGHAATGNFKGFFESGSKAQKDVADLFDKPAYVTTAQKTITPVSAMSHGKGTDTGVRLGLDPSALSEQPLHVFGGVKDEMTISHIVQTPMMTNRVAWADSVASGTAIQYFPVTPLVSAPVTTSSSVQVWQPTLMAWIASLYSFWQGPIKIRVDAICTSFHTGRLLIAFVPNRFTTPDPTLTQALSCPNVIMDIQSSTQIEFEIPFVSNVPYKDVSDTITVDSITGYIYVYVLNELVHPDNVAPSIDLNFYFYASDAFKLFVPKDVTMSLGNFVAAESESVEAMSDFNPIQETKTESQDSKVSLGFGIRSVSRINRFGEEFPIVDLIKRYSMFQPAYAGTQIKALTRPDGTLLLNPLGALSLIYAAWYGSLRYRFIYKASRTDADVVSVSYSPNLSTSAQLGLPLYVTNLAQDTGIEVEVPCYTKFNLLTTTPVSGGAGSQTYSSGYLTIAQSVMTPIAADVYAAAGDDFRFYYMVAPPTCFGLFVN